MIVTHRISLLLLAGAALCSTARGAEPFSLVAGGTARAAIVMDARPDALNREVVEDFTAILARISGAAFPLTGPAQGSSVYIGEADEFANLPFTPPTLTKEEFLLKVAPEAVYILGGSSLGTSHGVYTLLRDLGCRWIMPGEIGECLPHSPDIVLPLQERVEGPDFSYREIVYAYGSSPEAEARRQQWLRRNRMHRPEVRHTHNLVSTLSRIAPYEQRPELYALVQGERKRQQICTSNSEAIEGVVQSIKAYLREHPETEAYSLCPDDNTDFCECPNCKALDPGHIDRGGLPSVADRYQTFLNDVLKGLEDEFPKAMVSTYSYNRSHTDPPVNTPVDPRTCIFTTASQFCSAHGVGDDYCASRQDFRGLLESWTKLTPHVYIYEYDPVPYSGGLPWPMWKSHAKEMAVYKEIGVAGIYFEGQDSWASYFPNYYIGAQCMWNSAQDGAALFEDMLDNFFGEAAPDMRAYYGALDSALDGLEKKAEWGLPDYPQYFSSGIVENARKALEAAEARTAPEMIRRRIEMVRLSFDEMDAYLNIRRADASTTFERYHASVEQLENTIDRMTGISEDYLLGYIAKEKTSVGLADRFAREQGFINQWLLCGPFDNLGMDGHDRIYPPEQEIALDAAYTGKDGVTAAWKPNNTPAFMGYVDLLREFNQTDWVCAYALCWVEVNDGPREVMFRVGSNDSVKVFLNGKEIWNNKIERAISVDDDMIPVTLPQGRSAVMLKIGQTGLNWGFHFRITEPVSRGIPAGLRTTVEPPK